MELVVVSCWIEIDTEVEWKADKINLTLAIQEQIGNGKESLNRYTKRVNFDKQLLRDMTKRRTKKENGDEN